MSNAMSFAQLEDQTAELLPARTVLSLIATSAMNNPAPSGQNSNPTGGEHPMYDAWMNALTLLGVPHYQAPADTSSH
ncbi:MAG TPA: hypothetical protein VE673_00275 [Pseudonocardiaceae bacterium]|jgi:hypothetical protein|nr:hypothetical protein [Pseudonocardiaceae bacterium]